MPDLYLALDITTSRLSAAVIDSDGKVVLRDSVISSSRNMHEEILRLASRVSAASPARPVACGVAWPGTVTADGQLMARHVPSWNGLGLRRSLEDLVDMPVAIDSRGRAVALAATWIARPRSRSTIVILTDEVVDAGIVADGRLLSGRSMQAGQIAHLIVEPDGLVCLCGSHGCLDAYVGSLAIQGATRRALSRTPVTMIERAGVMLARAIASLLALVDSPSVILTGPVAESFGAPLVDSLERELPLRSRLSHLREVEVSVKGTGKLGPLFGAAAVARHDRSTVG